MLFQKGGTVVAHLGYIGDLRLCGYCAQIVLNSLPQIETKLDDSSLTDDKKTGNEMDTSVSTIFAGMDTFCSSWFIFTRMLPCTSFRTCQSLALDIQQPLLNVTQSCMKTINSYKTWSTVSWSVNMKLWYCFRSSFLVIGNEWRRCFITFRSFWKTGKQSTPGTAVGCSSRPFGDLKRPVNNFPDQCRWWPWARVGQKYRNDWKCERIHSLVIVEAV